MSFQEKRSLFLSMQTLTIHFEYIGWSPDALFDEAISHLSISQSEMPVSND